MTFLSFKSPADPGTLNILVNNEQCTPISYGTKEQELFSTSLIVAASGASAVAVGAGVLVYFKKRKQ